MRWNKYRIKTLAFAEDLIISSLMELGIEGVEIEDQIPLTDEEKRLMFVDIPPEVEAGEDAYISFYLEENQETEEVIRQVKAALLELRDFTDIGAGTIEESKTEDKDWINNWKEHFKQFYIDDILITPSWQAAPAADREGMVIQIDPGTAFGTGMHETTQLCIRELRKYINDQTIMLDIGCGSGILSLLGLKFGAKRAVMTDLDPCVPEAVSRNMAVNGIGETAYEVLLGNLIDDPAVQDRVGYECYDLAAANILAEVLIPLAPAAAGCLKPGGVLVVSGIIEGKSGIVEQALRAAGLSILRTKAQGEWRSITAKKG